MSSRIAATAVAIAAVSLAAATSATGAPTADQHVRVISSCTKATYQPKSYFFNDCEPSCVAGTVHEQAAEFTAYRVRDTLKQGPLFTRIAVDTRRGHHVFEMTTRPY
jgi:hypothetical protein